MFAGAAAAVTEQKNKIQNNQQCLPAAQAIHFLAVLDYSLCLPCLRRPDSTTKNLLTPTHSECYQSDRLWEHTKYAHLERVYEIHVKNDK